MTCELCGSSTWCDDDLHWIWCKNPKCPEHFSDNEKYREFLIAIAEMEKDREFRGYDA